MSNDAARPFDFAQSYFELLAQPPRFSLDLAGLEQAYRELQARVHPDKFAHATDAERRASMQWATHANAAYRTLKQPLERARYLLKLHGVDTLEESNTAMPAEFLLQQMDRREAVVEAETQRDVAALAHLADELQREMDSEFAALARLLDQQQNWSAAALSVRKLKFMDKLKTEIGDALDTLDA